MNNLTKEQMLELAKIVTGIEHHIHHGRIWRTEKAGLALHEIAFDPKLDGEDWQVAQACRVIVAALNLGQAATIGRYEDRYWVSWVEQSKVDPVLDSSKNTGAKDDLLTAASLALISGGRS